ncbi:integrase [Bacteroides sp. 51]|nr:integrase [Bacteroides sp. 51]
MNRKEASFMANYNIKNYRNSILSPFIRDFIRLKKGLGFKAERIETGLWAFDTFAHNKGNQEIALSKELVEEWCAKRPNETVTTWSHRINYIRQLATYLYNLGYDAYIPVYHHARRETVVPYIYTDAQLEEIYNATNILVQQRHHPGYCLFSVPALIRMLAGTGIRLGEAVNLLDKDVDLGNNCLILRDTKNGRERLVPISESLSEVCRQYRQYKSLLPYIHSNTFFVKLNGTKCTNESFGHWWNQILKMAGIPHLGKQRGPRIHDLRHSFCVKTMARLAKQGKDLYHIMPILSMYIGHLSLKATDKYVRLTSEIFPELLSQTDSICTYIYPDFKRL